MSKSSTATVPKIPTPLPAKSAWARGPPQSSTASSPRSQSPAPSTPVLQTHSRRPSALGQGIPIKDGVSIPRNNVGAVKQGSAVTFGSIDDVSAPISSSPAAVPPTKSEGVKTFGSVPVATGHVNGKASISSRASVVSPTASTSTAASSPVLSAAAPLVKSKIDIKKMFQNPSSTPSSNPPSDTSSPSMRNVSLPTQQQQPHQGQSSHPPPNPSQLGAHSFIPFVPNNSMRPPQNSGPNGGPPRSTQYPRQMSNGNGPRSQGGQNGGPPAGLSSPRLTPHPHNTQTSTMPPPPPPQMQPQMHQPMWYYQYPPSDQAHFMPYQQWYNPMQMPPQHQPPPHQPHPGPQMPHTGMPTMSPRNPPSALQGPATPTLSHAIASPAHPPHPPALTHPSNSLGLTSPPPTPSTPSISSANRLDAGSRTFVPRTAAKITVKKADGTEVSLENLTKSTPSPSTPVPPPQSSVLRQGSPGTPNRRPTSIRMETEDQHKSRLAEQEQKDRLKVEAADKEKKEKEEAEAERKAKLAEEIRKLEESARLDKELEEQNERRRKQQEDMLRMQAESLRLKEEERRLKLKQEEERISKAKQEEEKALRLAQERAKEEKEEKERKEKERKEKEEREEQERLSKLAEETRLRLEEEAAAAAAAKVKAEAIPEPEPEQEQEQEEPEVEANGDGKQDGQLEDGKDVDTETSKAMEDGRDKSKDVLRINTASISPTLNDKRRPGPLDLTSVTSSASPVVAALATARVIADFATVPYPEGVNSPHPDLNQNVKDGKFRYDREFLLQFMSVCKERPATLPPLDAIGLEPVDHTHAMSRGGSGRRASGPVPPSRQASIGLGFTPSALGKPGANNLFSMGNFGTMGAGNKLSSEERYANSSRAASVSGAAGMQYASNRPSTLQRTASQGGAGAPLQKRVRSKRGENRNENNRLPGGSGGQGHGSGFNNMNQMQNFDPVVPLQATENRWDRKSIQVDQDSPELVERKVKGLLNKLTMEKFASISDQIIAWANKSEKEKDGRTLIQVIRLVFEKATDEATWSEMYARLCRKMMEQISTNVQDDGIKNADGKPITGGQLFRKYLLNRCQEDFERGWVAKEATAAAAATKALEDEAAKAANAKTKEAGTEEIVLYSDEYYAAQKAKRQGLGLIKFIGELFKLQMLTERIMHECVKKLLGNVDNPEEEEIESLCKLLATVGSMLDTQKARAHLDVYFSRMKELTKSPNVTPRMQYMLQDLLELRERKWVARNAVAAPTTIAQIHENAAKEKAAQEKESYQRQISMSRGGSRRGGDRGEFSQQQQQIGPDGWAVAGSGSGPPRPPPKAGDLSNFGKISKAQPLTFGPSSVFAGKKGAENKREAISRTNSSSNMFSMLSSQGTEASDKDKAAVAAEPLPQRKRLVLQPRSVPVEATSPAAESESSHSEEEASIEMTEESALKKVKEDLKEFFAVRNLEEAEVYFSSLPPQHHHLLVDKIVSSAVESKEDDAKLVSQFFALAALKELCSAASFEQGLTPVAEIIDDIAIDAPKAFQLLAMMVKGANLDQERLANLTSKSLDSDKFLALLQ